jgi:hypothetical protein
MKILAVDFISLTDDGPEVVSRVGWNGKEVVVIQKSESDFIKDIMENGVVFFGRGGRSFSVLPSAGKKFIDSLCKVYKGSYFLATKPYWTEV